jgi:Na+/H+-dicarboxylate symporter
MASGVFALGARDSPLALAQARETPKLIAAAHGRASAATLAVVHPALAPGTAMALGIDKFMSECRALTNICGNGLAAIVILPSEGKLDRAKLDQALAEGAEAGAPAAAAAA